MPNDLLNICILATLVWSQFGVAQFDGFGLTMQGQGAGDPVAASLDMPTPFPVPQVHTIVTTSSVLVLIFSTHLNQLNWAPFITYSLHTLAGIRLPRRAASDSTAGSSTDLRALCRADRNASRCGCCRARSGRSRRSGWRYSIDLSTTSSTCSWAASSRYS